MSTDRITFNCKHCGHAVSIDENNPPKDEDIIKCLGCGHEFGNYAVAKAAMIKAGKAEIDRLVEQHLGVKPTWTKK